MRFQETEPFENCWKRLPERIRRRAEKCLHLFAQGPRHPSLRVHRIKGTDIWEMSVTMNYRITFEWKGDLIVLRKIGTHDILRTP